MEIIVVENCGECHVKLSLDHMKRIGCPLGLCGEYEFTNFRCVNQRHQDKNPWDQWGQEIHPRCPLEDYQAGKTAWKSVDSHEMKVGIEY